MKPQEGRGAYAPVASRLLSCATTDRSSLS